MLTSMALPALYDVVDRRQASATLEYRFIQPSGGSGGRDMFVHVSAVERAGLQTLREGQSIKHEIESNRGKESAVNLRVK
jgi:CspA family cold shock protein